MKTLSVSKKIYEYVSRMEAEITNGYIDPPTKDQVQGVIQGINDILISELGIKNHNTKA